MNTERHRVRAAFPRKYRGRPASLHRLLPEVAAKSYQAVCLSAGHQPDNTMPGLCAAAVQPGLDVSHVRIPAERRGLYTIGNPCRNAGRECRFA